MPHKDPEKRKEYGAKHYQINKESIKEYNKKYRENNKEIIRERQKKWSDRNKEKKKQYQKEYRKNNKDKIYQKQLEWNYNNKDKRKAQRERYKGRHKIIHMVWAKANPQIILKQRTRHLKKYSIPFKLPHQQYGYALQSWSKTVKKEAHQLCEITDCFEKAEHAHHIFHKSKYPELSLNTNNGIGLCITHHREAHLFG